MSTNREIIAYIFGFIYALATLFTILFLIEGIKLEAIVSAVDGILWTLVILLFALTSIVFFYLSVSE